MTDRLGRLLLVTLEAGHVNAQLPVLEVLRSWLDSWRGIGAVERGMAHQGFDLQLTRYDDRGWRATFYTSGMEYSPTSATGTGWEPTAWHAVQAAARDALRNAESVTGEAPRAGASLASGGLESSVGTLGAQSLRVVARELGVHLLAVRRALSRVSQICASA